MKNREAVLTYLQKGEENQARIYEFGPYTMLPHGVFGDEDGRFSIEVSEDGMRSLADACKIPVSYIMGLPDSLKAANVNHGLSEHKVREKYDLIVSNFKLLGLIPKGSLFIPNGDLVTAINEAVSQIDRPVEYSLWETNDTSTALLVTLGETRIRVGFLILYYRLTGMKPYAYTVIWDETEGDKGKVIIVPGNYVIEPSNYAATLRTLITIKVMDREKYLLDGYVAFRTTEILDVFPSLADFLTFMDLGKRISHKIYIEYKHKFNIHNIQNVVDIIYWSNKSGSIFRRIKTGKSCGKLLLKVADYEHKRL